MNSKKDTPRGTAVDLLRRALGVISDPPERGPLRSWELQDSCTQLGVEHEWLMEEVDALLTEIALHVEHGQIASEDAVEDAEGYAPVPMGAGCG